MAFQDFNNSKS
ncbi:hypothetical protein BpHYR1_021013 [Brachionus plicatilis]|uniref:Uncharacterized protein n=1 Tax=Brachionus plicatilis TaxID=10195 RepID=A0A3M7SI60_BRAPC|nr:hypothetical protein BpHYR1_021013 [Brachionus plicatilis]